VLIADEAHRVHEVARAAWQISVSVAGVEPLVRAFAGEGRASGGVQSVRHLARRTDALMERATVVQLGEAAAGAMRDAVHRVRAFEHALHSALAAAGVDVTTEHARVRLRAAGAGRVLAGPGERAVAVDYPADESAAVMSGVREVMQLLRRMQDALDDIPQDSATEAAGVEVGTALEAWTRVHDAAHASLGGVDDSQVQWIERVNGSDALTLVAAPRDVSQRLGEALAARYRAVACTSATLAPGGDFAYSLAQLGLLRAGAWAVRTLAVSTPFPLDAQLRICAARNAPACGTRDHEEAVAALVVDLERRTGRNVLVLCTSVAMVRAVSARVRLAAAADGWPLFVQGEDGVPHAVVERFRSERGAVLIGTASLWEGIDLPGAECEIVVITRLPFPVPTDPVIESASEEVAAGGGDPFRELHIPHAQLRLVQGVGRVIRRTTDRGAVIVADPRIVTRSYGTAVRQSVPVPLRVSATLADVAAEVSEWCAGAACAVEEGTR
jgi:Rad3-related DNA helicase